MTQAFLFLALAVAALWIFFKILHLQIKFIFKFLINAGLGLVLMVIANIILSFFNLSITINFLTVMISGIFGIPGVIFLTLLAILF